MRRAHSRLATWTVTLALVASVYVVALVVAVYAFNLMAGVD